MRPVQFVYPASDRDGIALAQQLGAAGNLVINGALLDLPATMQGVRRVRLPGIQRVVTLFSVGNLSGVDFTITGFDIRGTAISEVIAGPNNTTVSTTAEFHHIANIAADAAVASDVEIGTGAAGATNWYVTDHYKTPNNFTVAIEVTGTASVTVQDTPDDVQTDASPLTFNHPILTAVSASAESNYAFPPRSIRFVMNSGSGAFTGTIIQAG